MPHPALPVLRVTAFVVGLYFSTCVRVVNISSYYTEKLFLTAMYKTVVMPHEGKHKQKILAIDTLESQAEKLLSQRNQIKQTCTQVKKSSGSTDLARLSSESLKIQYKSCALLLSNGNTIIVEQQVYSDGGSEWRTC